MKEQSVAVKICGLTSLDEAISCARWGADFIGFVFYEKSLRNITKEKAREIIISLPERVISAGVFVDEEIEKVIGIAKYCNLKTMQLHGGESPEYVNHLKNLGFMIIKTIFINGQPGIAEMEKYNADAYLLEPERGKARGGTGEAWDFSLASELSLKYPLILAGGLTSDNVAEAIMKVKPDAVDISSGVEFIPGHKDMNKVIRFIRNVKGCSYKPVRRILNEK